jgi:hypothetical protein
MCNFLRETLPGKFYELNIHFGLYVGGQGDFSEMFLGHLDNLRGCMADVSYNGVNVLGKARERIGAVDVHGVTWSCAEEFDVGPERDVSFVEEGAFIALPNAISRTGARYVSLLICPQGFYFTFVAAATTAKSTLEVCFFYQLCTSSRVDERRL